MDVANPLCTQGSFSLLDGTERQMDTHLEALKVGMTYIKQRGETSYAVAMGQSSQKQSFSFFRFRV